MTSFTSPVLLQLTERYGHKTWVKIWALYIMWFANTFSLYSGLCVQNIARHICSH